MSIDLTSLKYVSIDLTSLKYVSIDLTFIIKAIYIVKQDKYLSFNSLLWQMIIVHVIIIIIFES